MESFDKMGEAMLLAAEGQRQIARALFDALGRGLSRMMDRVARGMSKISYPHD